MTAENFIKIQRRMGRIMAACQTTINDARKDVKIPPEGQLRPMTAIDLKEGTIVYHVQRAGISWAGSPSGVLDKEQWYWHIIERVKHPDGDDFKAYVADDGCRYGLKDAFVRMEKCDLCYKIVKDDSRDIVSGKARHSTCITF